jgi:pimeloyl-ACP methyl ester carboxylesterase
MEFGAGETVVLLGSTWSPAELLVPLASALASRWRVLVPSFPGYDGAPAYPGVWTHDVERTLLEDTLLSRGAGSIAGVVGCSLGGYRALSLACSRRVLVRCAVSLGGLAELSPQEREGLRAMGAAVREGRLPFRLGEAAVSPTYAAAHPEVLRTVDRWSDLVDWRSIAAEYEAIAASPSLLPDLERLAAPVLARVGELDAALPPSHSEAIARTAPGGTLERVPGVGHMLLLEDADATTQAIVAFLHGGTRAQAPSSRSAPLPADG